MLNSQPFSLPSVPRVVEILITSRCNLNCSYCSHLSSSSDVGTDVPTEEWCSFFNELKDCGVKFIVFGGGEPFIRDDLHTLIKQVANAGMRFQILTNGTLITEEIAAFIASTNSCHSIQLSVDGAQPATHDIFRGTGTFHQVIRSINVLQSYEIPLQVRVTLHKKNLFELADIASFLLQEMGLPSFSVNSASYLGKCRQNASSIQLTKQEWIMAMQSLLSLEQQYPGRIKAQSGPLADIKRLIAFRSKEKTSNTTGYLSGCHGVWKKIAVRSDGVFVPCMQLCNLELGKINLDSVRDVWTSNKTLISLRNRIHIPLTTIPKCKNCTFIQNCTGNCPALSYAILGKVDFPSPDGCLKELIEEYDNILVTSWKERIYQ